MPLSPISNPPNPWSSTEVEYLGEPPIAELQVYEDHSRSILATNDSPDVGFRYSVNPYRGCYHACAYCYARRTHEYLSFGAGTDFDRKIVVKPRAPELLREAFRQPAWTHERVAFSGVTDCYQPLEASYRLTRGCLEVCLEHKNPVCIVTKAPLIERDVDLLVELAAVAEVAVSISIPIWDKARARAIEPYVATPERRMKTIAALASHGLSVGINVAPMIPSVSDEDVVELLEHAKEAGAEHAWMGFLRLPGSVKEVFVERIEEVMPLGASRLLALVRDARGGALNDARFGVRETGEGPYAETVQKLFETTARRLGLDIGKGDATAEAARGERPPRPSRPKRRPRVAEGQLELFGPGATG